MTFGSLFTGIGGLDLGFERAGLSCAWQCEIDDYCRRVLSKHWPDIPKHDNVMTFTGEGFERPDIICGGFPCQDVSLAGERAGLAGKRSGLWSEFARLIRFFRPRYVFVENVPGLLSPVDDGSVAPIADVLGDMAACGYDAEWQSIPAYVFGSTQERFRVCIVAYAAGLGSGQRGIPVFPQRWEGPCDSQGAGESDRRASGLGANRECDSHALRAGREELHISAVAVEPGFDHRIPDAYAHADGFGGRTGGRGELTHFVKCGKPRGKMTPTLTASSADRGPESLENRESRAGSGGPTINDAIAHLSGRGGGVLNPRWCEWYMGFPVGWCEMQSADSETA